MREPRFNVGDRVRVTRPDGDCDDPATGIGWASAMDALDGTEQTVEHVWSSDGAPYYHLAGCTWNSVGQPFAGRLNFAEYWLTPVAASAPSYAKRTGTPGFDAHQEAAEVLRQAAAETGGSAAVSPWRHVSLYRRLIERALTRAFEAGRLPRERPS